MRLGGYPELASHGGFTFCFCPAAKLQTAQLSGGQLHEKSAVLRSIYILIVVHQEAVTAQARTTSAKTPVSGKPTRAVDRTSRYDALIVHLSKLLTAGAWRTGGLRGL